MEADASPAKPAQPGAAAPDDPTAPRPEPDRSGGSAAARSVPLAPSVNAPVTTPDERADRSLTYRRATRILAGLLAAAAALVVSGVLYWRLVPDAPPPPPRPAVATPPPLGTTLEAAVALAERQANRWLPGARLLNATMQVDWPWQVPAGRTRSVPATGWVTTVFLAPWDAPFGRNETAASLSLVIERLSGEIVLQETLGWEAAALPAATPVPSIDSTTAGLLAERAGGTRFRRACPDLRHLSRIGLVANAPGYPPHWLVTYEDAREPAQFGLLLRIGAADGAVLERREDAAPCP